MNFLDPALETYAGAHTSGEPAALQRLAALTQREIERPMMLSGHLQGRYLSLLSKLVAPRTVVDIGTYTGYSALCLAEGLAPDGTVHTIDVNAALGPVVEAAIADAGMVGRIVRHIAPAADVIPKLAGPFDLVFIDADKENYCTYWDLVVERLRPGGLVLADNVLWSGKVVAPEREWDVDTRGLVEFSRKVKADPRVDHVLVPIRDGLMVARKR